MLKMHLSYVNTNKYKLTLNTSINEIKETEFVNLKVKLLRH